MTLDELQNKLLSVEARSPWTLFIPRPGAYHTSGIQSIFVEQKSILINVDL